MGNLYERISLLCQERGIKGGKMCTDVGISKGLLTDLKMGRRTGVSAVTAQKIASYFNVSVGYLIGDEEKKENSPSEQMLTEGEEKMLELFRLIPKDRQAEALDLLRVALKMQQKP